MPDWQDRIRTIAGGLLSLEVNTIEKSNMAASKMPEFPLALHEIVETYAEELAARKVFITDDLLDAAQAHIEDGADRAKRAVLETWPFKDSDTPSDQLTNGPRTFEALRWAAQFALDAMDGRSTAQASTSNQGAVDNDVVRGLLVRMLVNSGELRQISLLLRKQLTALPGREKLFEGTRDDTLSVLFGTPRPVYDIDADMQLVVRKIWDIGLERVLFQTVMQVDGDVMVRVAPDLDATRRVFYAEMHRATVETGIKQWQGLFNVVGALLQEMGQALFGRRS